MNTLGRHVIAEFYGCSHEKLDTLEVIRTHMLHAAEMVGATVVGETFHRFAPQGVSGSVVIAESHVSIHTWPESGYVSVDMYTCGGLNPRPGIDYLATALEARSHRIHEILRGLPEELSAQRDLCADDVQIISHIAPETPLPRLDH